MDQRPAAIRYGILGGALALCLGVAWAGSAVTIPSVHGWYRTLQQPAFTPPDWLFAPVWTTLYLMMAVAGWRAWEREGFGWRSRALALFLVQLALNCAWSFLFFGGHLITVSAIEIVVLWLAIAATTAHFFRVDRLAGALMVPYLAWVTFAVGLNLAFMLLN